MENKMTGCFARSLAGHDKGKLYYILKEEADAFLVCDGDIRPLEKPKKKNKKHVQVINVNLAEKPFEINSDLLTNELVKRTIKLYRKEDI